MDYPVITTKISNTYTWKSIVLIKKEKFLKKSTQKKKINLTLNTFRKYELHMDNTTLCALNSCPSHDSVTSTKSSLVRRLSNSVTMFNG